MSTTTTDKPAAAPATTTTDAPRDLSIEEQAISIHGSTVSFETDGAAEPTMQPPGTLQAAGAAIGAGWLSGKKVTALWANLWVRNAWAHLDGVGWKKLADANDNATASLTMLASAARQAGTVNALEGADAKLGEIYLW